ncbi:hypothetical protein [Arthrobacter sp. RIT-PI-e]|uniref:hypothetical protein n=1 Tax=Arthrobacter sp. RIT-PI-e TaxID=1681197 RepID=UPI00128F17B1|nr:hypothetical protein [Arthrobacter sp. RIT-PI-e]
MRYRRARTLLIIIGLFWSWLGLGGGGDLIAALHSPITGALVLYALAVSIPVTIAAAVLAAMRMLLMHPRRGGVVVRLPAAPRYPPRSRAAEEVDRGWSYRQEAS